MELLAINGGAKAVTTDPGDLFTWPIVTREDEDAVLAVLRAGKMSELDETMALEKELAEWHGAKYVLCHCNGTAALHSAMFGCHIGVGDEIICPSLTYWASALPAFSLGATVVFTDVARDTLCIAPNDIAPRITPRTRAIIVVHYCGYPCDMDPIMAIAERHGLKVIEDVSHAQGGLYKGRLLGTIGHVCGASMMSGKSLACGEGGYLLTDDQEIYERALAFGHYARHASTRWGGDRAGLTLPELKRFKGVPLGGYKYRPNQTASAMGRVQLRHYAERMAEIQRAMNYFWDLLDGVPGVVAHRPASDSGSTMAGWYAPKGLYDSEQLNGLPLARFAEAVAAEGAPCAPGANEPLHLHPVLNDADVYHHGKPTRMANSDRDLRQPHGSLPVSEASAEFCYNVPWFKRYRPEHIKEYADAFRKVAEHADELA